MHHECELGRSIGTACLNLFLLFLKRTTRTKEQEGKHFLYQPGILVGGISLEFCDTLFCLKREKKTKNKCASFNYIKVNKTPFVFKKAERAVKSTMFQLKENIISRWCPFMNEGLGSN